jgi:hypothetical protein
VTVQQTGFSAVAWNNGSHDPSGNGYGLKISAQDRDRHLRREWGSVALYLAGQGEPVSVNVDKASLWNDTCRELISRQIGTWLIARGLAPWPKGSPPKLAVVPRGPRQFDVRLT